MSRNENQRTRIVVKNAKAWMRGATENSVVWKLKPANSSAYSPALVEFPVKRFTKKYNINKLVYFEQLDNKHKAANREKQLKGLLKKKKLQLISLLNPDFKDLSIIFSLPWDPSLVC